MLPLLPLPQKFDEYGRAEATIEGLSKKVNKKVMQMFEKAEQEYTELKRKKDVVEGDKNRIEQVCVGGGVGGGAWHSVRGGRVG